MAGCWIGRSAPWATSAAIRRWCNMCAHGAGVGSRRRRCGLRRSLVSGHRCTGAIWSYIGAGGKKRRVWVFVMTMACPCAPSPGNSASLATQCANTPTPRDRPPRSSVPRSEPSCWGYANPNALPNNRPNVFAFHLIVQNRWTTINAGPITSNIDNLILPHSVAGVGPSAPPMLRLIRRRQWATRPPPC